MIQTIRLSTSAEVSRLFSEDIYRTDLDRYRSQFIYRGMSDSSFHLETSLYRNCGELKKTLEPLILRNFAKYAVLEDSSIGQSVWRQMILGQHHGLPTRLLDFSHSALMALNFSVTEPNLDDMDKHDSMVIRVDMAELHRLLPEKYRQVLRKYSNSTIFTVDMLDEMKETPESYDEDMKGRGILVIEPPSLDARIINQYSFFAVIPSDMLDIEAFLNENTENTVKYIIPKELRWRVRDLLDQQNISERIAYPGLDGMSKWIARHYYVKHEVRPEETI